MSLGDNTQGLEEVLDMARSLPDRSASNVTYDDTETKLGATNVQEAVSKLSEQIEDLKENGTTGGTGWTEEQINLLDSIGNFIPFTSADGGTLWDNLIESLKGNSSGDDSGETDVTLSVISATYSGGSVLVGTSVNDLTGIVVTATYSDGSKATVTDYTLSGTIAEGSNKITVSYGGKFTTITVIGYAEEEPEVTLTSITVSYAGGDVTVGTALTDLTGITVTGHYSDGSTANITGYSLSGEIAEGSNTITVSYNGKTATFTVVGIAESTGGDIENNGWESGVPYEITWKDGYKLDNTTGEEIGATGSMSVSDYLPCHGVNRIQVNNIYSNYGIFLYDENKNFLRRTYSSYPVSETDIWIPDNVYYARAYKRLATTNASVTPYHDNLLDASTVWEADRFYRLNWKDGININNGNEGTNDSSSTSDFALCYGATHYLDSESARHFINWYDADKNYLSNSTIQNITTGVDIPDGASYFRTVIADVHANLWVKLS